MPATASPAIVRAYVTGSSIDAHGALTVEGHSEQRIGASVSAGATAAAKGGTAGIAISGSGVYAENKIGVDTAAFIDGAGIGHGGVQGANVILAARDTSTIDTKANATAVAITKRSGTTGVAVAIGVSLAFNTITSAVDAHIADLNGGVVTENGGDISITARETATIHAESQAASVSFANGGTTGIAVSGGGAVAQNRILTRTNAWASNTSLGTGPVKVGDVSVTADDQSTIRALVTSLAVSASWGGTTGVGVSIGISVARNFIGYGAIEMPADTLDYTSYDNPMYIVNSDVVRVDSGPREGDVYEYIGIGFTDEDDDADGIDLDTQNYGDVMAWRQINLAAAPAQARAFIENTSVHATGDLTLSADYDATIDALVLAGAVALSGGGTTGVAVSGAGVYAENKIYAEIKAFIKGDGVDDAIFARNVSLRADDASNIDAIAGAASLAGSIGGTTGVSVSIGISLAFNEIANDVAAYLEDVNLTTYHGGDVDLSATARGADAFNLSFDEIGLSAEDLDDAAKRDQDNPDNPVTDDEDVDDPNDPRDDPVNEAVIDIRGDVEILGRLREGFEAGGITLADRYSVVRPWTYTSDEIVPDYASTDTEEQHLREGDWVEYLGDKNNGKYGRLYQYVGEDIEDDEEGIDLRDENYTILTKWRPRDLHHGDTVKLSHDYDESKGKAGGMYRYIGKDPDSDATKNYDVDLSTENYTNTYGWVLLETLELSILEEGKRWTLVAPDGDTWFLTKVGDNLEVSGTTINAISAAASLAVGIGGATGVAISGAGAVAQNVIRTDTNAAIDSSNITSAGAVTLQAESDSVISSTVAAASMAVGGGGATGIGASIGIAVARNFIGWHPDGTKDAAEVHATIRDSSVWAVGALTQKALANQEINALVLSASAALALGGATGVAISGSGVFAENKIGVDVGAWIDGDGVGEGAGITAAGITLTALDTSSITATAAAASLAASFGGATGVAISIGVSLAFNTITSVVDAYIANVGANADDGVTTTTGAIRITATETAVIRAISAAASLAAGFGGATGVAISGAGAVAYNTILTRTRAYVKGSALTSAGDVDILATNAANIDAIIIAASFAASVGGATGIGASIGLSLARNFIGSLVDESAPADYTTDEVAPPTIRWGDTVKVKSGVRAGDVYKYVGKKAITLYDHGSDEGDRYIEKEDRVKITKGFQGKDRNGVVNHIYEYRGAEGSVDLAGAEYRVTRIETEEDEDGETKRKVTYEEKDWVSVGSANLSSQDYGNTDKWIRINYIDAPIEVLAYVKDSSITAGGALTQIATADQAIDAIVFAGAAAISGGGAAGVGLSGAGAGAENVIMANVKAYIDGDGDGGISANTITLKANDLSSIDAITAAASLAGAVGGAVGVAASVGVAIAYNTIDNDVAAYIGNAGDVNATSGDIVIEATSRSGGDVFSDEPLTLAELGLTAAQLDDAAREGEDADGSPDNVTQAKDEADAKNKADLRDDMSILTQLRAVLAAKGRPLALDDALPGGAKYLSSQLVNRKLREGDCVQVADGHTAGGEIGRVYRYLGEDSDQKTNLGYVNYDSNSNWVLVDTLRISILEEGKSWILVAPDGETLFLTLGEDGQTLKVAGVTINAISAAASVALGFGGAAGIAVSGAGALAQNEILTDTNAYIQGSRVTSAGDVRLDAVNTALIASTVATASAALAAGGAAGIGVSIGVSLARNLIGWELTDDIEIDHGTEDKVAPYQVVQGDTVKIESGGRRGHVYRYIGDTTLYKPTTYLLGQDYDNERLWEVLSDDEPVPSSVSSSSPPEEVSKGTVVQHDGKHYKYRGADTLSRDRSYLLDQDYGDSALWERVDLKRTGSEVGAFIERSGVDAGGNLTLTALSDQGISSLVFSGSAALAGGTIGIAAAGAGAGSENLIGMDVRAYIGGDGGHGVTADSIAIKADDTSTISAVTLAVSVAASFGVIGGSIAVGVAVATNAIDNQVVAYINHAGSVTTTVGGVLVSAEENASITSLTVSASASISGSIGGAVAAAVTVAENLLTTRVGAYVDNVEDLQSAGGVALQARDISRISAEIFSVALSAGMVSLAVGAVDARNINSNRVSAAIIGSRVTARGIFGIMVLASANPTIDTKAIIGAISFGMGGSGTGGNSETLIHGITEAYVTNSDLIAEGNNILNPKLHS